MKITKVRIRNLFGISETELDGRNVEVTGANGTGKTSIIDAIKLALTNDSDRDYVIKQGEQEGEIIVETDTGLYIDRKKRTGKADYKSIKDGGKDVPGPEAMLKTLFTQLQIDPVAFIQKNRKEQNRLILDLIEFDWDLNWIKEKFGEIPRDVNYEQNILEVLNDIQAENGFYYQTRQDVNRDLRNKKAFVEEIAETIPAEYDAEKWEAYDLGDTYRRIEQAKVTNGRIERAKVFKDSYDNKVRGYEAEKELAVSAEKDKIAAQREELAAAIEKHKAEIKAAEDKLGGLDDILKDKIAIAESQFKEKVAKLDSDIKTADEYINKKPIDTAADEEEVRTAEAMKKHLNEYRRMMQLQEECAALKEESDGITEKIELARTLPGEILETATIPVEGLTVENGQPLINGLPVSNLSEGEKLELCVDVALSKPNNLQIILIDGAEKLSDANRKKLYKKCKDKGLQFIATRTDNSEELNINYL